MQCNLFIVKTVYLTFIKKSLTQADPVRLAVVIVSLLESVLQKMAETKVHSPSLCMVRGVRLGNINGNPPSPLTHLIHLCVYPG